jgi:hypothetical protein
VEKTSATSEIFKKITKVSKTPNGIKFVQSGHPVIDTLDLFKLSLKLTGKTHLTTRVARFFLVHDTKTGKNAPNEHKMYQMVIKYPGCP